MQIYEFVPARATVLQRLTEREAGRNVRALCDCRYTNIRRFRR